MVSPSKQIFKCFGCGKGGNVITFVQEIERIDFRDTIKQLAKSANIDLTQYQNDKYHDQAYTDEKEKIKRIHKLAQKFLIDQLESSDEAKKYLAEQRKLDPETVEKFGIGYAPNSHYALIQELKTKGFSEDDMIQASLAKRGQSWDIYCFFKHRITFPIYDTMQNIIGFSARIIDPNDKPKYLNSSEHKAFEKSKVLYWLNRAKQDIKEYNALIVVEGQMDVIGLSRVGFPIGVATCGTALTMEHIKLIKRYTENMYLMFDNDDAWQEASIRGLNTAFQQNIFPKIITLPEEVKDIDELANNPEGKKLFQRAFEKAQDGFAMVLENQKKKFDMTSPVDKQKVLNIMFGLLQNISSVSIGQHYEQVLSDALGMRFEFIHEQFKKYTTSEWKIFQRQKKSEPKYEIDRSLLIKSLFYESFINQFVEDADLREPLITLESLIAESLPETKMQSLPIDDPQHEAILQLQLRREHELSLSLIHIWRCRRRG